MRLTSFVGRLQVALLDRPRSVLLVSALLVVVALLLGLGVEFRTSRNELAAADDPDQRRWDALLADYAGAEAFIACVETLDETADPARLRPVVDRLAAAFRADAVVDHVFHRVDVDWFLERALHLAPPQTLREVAATLRDEPELLDGLGSLRGFADLNDQIAARIERGLDEGGAVPEEGDGAGDSLLQLLEAEHAFLLDPGATVDRWTAEHPVVTLAGVVEEAPGDGYLKTHDGRTWFLVISPVDADDSLATYRQTLQRLQGRVDEVRREFDGFRVVFTGRPAIVVEEMATIRGDTWRTSIVAVVGVCLLTLLVFRWKSHALLVLVALAAGLAWSFGAVRLELGYLNLITSSFLSTLVGVGVAYSIHPLSEYELAGAHTADPGATVRESYRRTGAAVTTAAVTTSAAFFSILLMQFPGFAELGLVAGVGVLLCLMASLIVLPALLQLYGQWRRRRDRSSRTTTITSAIDRLWIERISGNVCRWPRLVLVAASLLTVGLGLAASRTEFETNFFKLLPQNADSIRYQEKLAFESDLSPLFNLVAVDDLAELREVAARAAAEPEIARVESLLRLLPADPAASASAIEELRPLIDRFVLPRQTREIDPGRLSASLLRLEEALAEASDAAFVAGLAAVAGPLESARAEAEQARVVVESADFATVAAWNAGQSRLLDWAVGAEEWLQRAVRQPVPTIDRLPVEMRDRFVTRSGRLLAFLYPTGDVFEPAELTGFVEASRRVSPGVTGFPIVFSKTSVRIVDGFGRAVGVGAILVLLILFLDFGSLRDSMLAIVPLALGVVWMLGLMNLVGMSFNFANLVAVPLIIGVGIDNGVHVIQRVRLEGQDGMGVVLRHTGRGVLIASLTTMIGFGSLALASHRGMSSLGTLLLLGVGACLVTSMVVLPNLLVWFGLVRR